MKTDINNPVFLKSILDHVPDALMLVDKKLRIHFANKSFKQMFDMGEDAQFDELLGETIKCKDFHKDNPYKCAHCKLSNTIRDAFETKSNQESGSIVLQIMIEKEYEIRLIQYQANFLEMEETEFVLMKMNDFTKLGDEAILMGTKA